MSATATMSDNEVTVKVNAALPAIKKAYDRAETEDVRKRIRACPSNAAARKVSSQAIRHTRAN